MQLNIYSCSYLLIISSAALLSLVAECALAGTVTYTYDNHHRLTSSAYDDGTTIRFTFDAAGNRLSSVSSLPVYRTYEDAEDASIIGWDIFDSEPAGAIVTNVYDSGRGSRVIELTGSGTNNGYRLRNANSSSWNDTNFKVMEWSMKYGEAFTVTIAVQTKKGPRSLNYTPVDTDNLGADTNIHHGLGLHVKNGQWHTLVRDLERDLKEAQPDNELLAVLAFLVRGSGRVDDIKTRKQIPADHDSDGDTIADVMEMFTYGTNPYDADSDGDGIADNEELAYWGAHWNADVDGDGLINLLDPDADNDGFVDGIERSQGTNPADPASAPTFILYENGEDGTVVGWDIFDSDPAGATVTNVYDSARASRVIELSGSGISNCYRLRNADGSPWNDVNFKVMEWGMKYGGAFSVTISIQTKNGPRLLNYTPVDTDNLGTDTNIHHGLGLQVMDGQWHTLTRNLEQDLKEAQPDNELQAVLAF